jgi:hypothetical protein
VGEKKKSGQKIGIKKSKKQKGKKKKKKRSLKHTIAIKTKMMNTITP